MKNNVPDFDAYRAKKILSGMSQQRLLDRITLVTGERDGWDNPRLQAFYAPMAFPNGYDPVNHPEDNLELLEAERVRRGV